MRFFELHLACVCICVSYQSAAGVLHVQLDRPHSCTVARSRHTSFVCALATFMDAEKLC